MTAELISISPEATDAPEILRAAKALEEGALVAFPTETVYGLAANAASGSAVSRLREVKGRAATQPFTVHIGRIDDCEPYVPALTNLGRRFIKKGWPGPLTLIFKVAPSQDIPIRPRLSSEGFDAIYSRGSVGVRCPDHAACASLLTRARVPVIASSANRAGQAAPIEAADIISSIGEEIDFVIDSGPTRYRKGSTIVELNGDGYSIIREGVWDERTIKRIAAVNILFVCTGNTCRSPIAEGLFRKMLAEKIGCDVSELSARGVNVISAGAASYGGGRASEYSIDVCRRRGVDISGHVSRGLSSELVQSADYIFGMTGSHVDAIATFPIRSSTIVAPLSTDTDINDPVGGPLEEYEETARAIELALRKRLNEVTV